MGNGDKSESSVSEILVLLGVETKDASSALMEYAANTRGKTKRMLKPAHLGNVRRVSSRGSQAWTLGCVQTQEAIGIMKRDKSK
jgi:hypothetical protein